MSPYGNIVSTRILRDQVSAASRGVGFVRYGHLNTCCTQEHVLWTYVMCLVKCAMATYGKLPRTMIPSVCVL